MISVSSIAVFQGSPSRYSSIIILTIASFIALVCFVKPTLGEAETRINWNDLSIAVEDFQGPTKEGIVIKKSAQKNTVPNQSKHSNKKKSSSPKLRKFRPSEEIKADTSISFPSDI